MHTALPADSAAAPHRDDVDAALQRFVARSRFTRRGGVFTDLDGTAVHEVEGRVLVPPTVERALQRLRDLGRPLVLNSLRFPLSVIRTFGREWYAISDAPLPLVSLNGSLLGRLVRADDGAIAFEEIEAFPLRESEVEQLLAGVGDVLAEGLRDVLVFAYPRDWRRGEELWTPAPEKAPALRERYRSAATVSCEPFGALRERLAGVELCMVFVRVDAPEDRLLAFQHTRRSSFFTRAGVDKLSGARRMAEHLGVEIEHSVGAGDTELDRFLEAVGLSVKVGPIELPFAGRFETVRVPDSHSLGELLFRLGELHGEPAAPGRGE